MTRRIVFAPGLAMLLAIGCSWSGQSPVAPDTAGFDGATGSIEASFLKLPGRAALRGTDLAFDIVVDSSGDLAIECLEGKWDVLGFKGTDEELQAVIFGGTGAGVRIREAMGAASVISLNFEEVILSTGGCDSPGEVLFSRSGAGTGNVFIDDIIIGIGSYSGARGLLIPSVQ